MRDDSLNPCLMALRRLILLLGGAVTRPEYFKPDEAYGLVPLLLARAERGKNLPDYARPVLHEFAALARIPIGAEAAVIARGIERVVGPAPDPEALLLAAKYIQGQANASLLEPIRASARNRTLLGLDLPPASAPAKKKS